MRVFAKKAFEFVNWGEKDGQKVVVERATTSPFSFCDLPDWVKNDPMFGWARKDGDIEIIQTKADEKAAELSAAAKPGPVRQKLLNQLSQPSQPAAEAVAGNSETADPKAADSAG
jgi:hypothetical protein